MNIEAAILALKTRDLLALYRTLTGKAVTKFATRAAGEKQTIAAAREAQPAYVKQLLKNLGAEEDAPETSAPLFGGHAACPKCAAKLDVRGVGEFTALAQKYGRDEALATQKQEWQCLRCGAEWGEYMTKAPKKGPRKGAKPPKDPKPKAAPGDRAAAIARSWADPEIAAKRKARHAVTVVNEKGHTTMYRSVPDAFRSLGLPMGTMIKFRMKLKAAGALEAHGYKWTVMPIN